MPSATEPMPSAETAAQAVAVQPEVTPESTDTLAPRTNRVIRGGRPRLAKSADSQDVPRTDGGEFATVNAAIAPAAAPDILELQGENPPSKPDVQAEPQTTQDTLAGGPETNPDRADVPETGENASPESPVTSVGEDENPLVPNIDAPEASDAVAAEALDIDSRPMPDTAEATAARHSAEAKPETTGTQPVPGEALPGETEESEIVGSSAAAVDPETSSTGNTQTASTIAAGTELVTVESSESLTPSYPQPSTTAPEQSPEPTPHGALQSEGAAETPEAAEPTETDTREDGPVQAQEGADESKADIETRDTVTPAEPEDTRDNGSLPPAPEQPAEEREADGVEKDGVEKKAGGNRRGRKPAASRRRTRKPAAKKGDAPAPKPNHDANQALRSGAAELEAEPVNAEKAADTAGSALTQQRETSNDQAAKP
jgi:hypothetical protein